MNRPLLGYWAAVGLALGTALAGWSGAEGVAAWTFAILLGLLAAAILGGTLTFLWSIFGPARGSKPPRDGSG